MNLLGRLKSRLAALFRKSDLDNEMSEEMRSHVELRTQANIEAGMNPEEARFGALRQFGWTESIKEECREQRGVRLLENSLRDLRSGIRQLGKNPGFTTVAALTLALGIGANTAIFSVVDRLLLRFLPVAEPQRLALIGQVGRGGNPDLDFNYPLFRDFQRENTVFSDLAAAAEMDVGLGAGGATERQRATVVSG